MPSLAAIAFLQCAFSVALGVDLPFRFTPSTNNEGIAPYPVFGAVGPTIPDIRPDFGVGLSQDDIGAEDKETLPFAKNPFVADYKPNIFSERFGSRVLSFQEWSNRPYIDDYHLREYFAWSLVERVKASKELLEAIQTPPQCGAKSLFSLIHQAHLSVGSPDARISAEVVSKAVAANFDNIKEYSILPAVANTLAKYLSFRDAITKSNVASLCEQLIKLAKKYLNSVQKPSPEENFKAVFGATIDFLKSLGLYTLQSTAMVSGLFANELYFLGY